MTPSPRERALEAALTLAIHGLDNDGQASACAALNTKGRAALALPSSPLDADMLAALRIAHHALEGRERKDVALKAVAAAIRGKEG